jgi:uncharacterized protein (DUF2141 family)
MGKIVLRLFILCTVIYAFNNCARRGIPTGGPKDSIPPVVLKALPNLQTVNFSEERIKIYFDEYIKLKDVKKQLVISPPQKYEPIITPLGTASKILTIKILDTLDANTTYAFNFGNSIVDNNEENMLGNFKYVFSTGNFIDSLSLSGEINDPTVKKTIDYVDVMLYEYNDKYYDSIIFKEKPRYIASTLDSTLFDLTNLRSGKYLLIAVKDNNNNKIYNPQTDKIGFIKDTITLPTEKKFKFNIFKEIPPLKLIRPQEASKGHIIFGFEGDAKDLNIKLLTQKPEDFKSKIIYEKTKDTINYWFTPFETDSLYFEVSKNDLVENFTVKPRSSTTDSLKIQKSAGSVLHLADTFSISANTPITTFDFKGITILKNDSIPVNFNPIFAENSNKIYLDFEKEHNTNYKFELLPNTVTDIFGVANDSLKFNLKTLTPEDYGKITVDIISAINTPVIVELLDEKNERIRLVKIAKPTQVSFDVLPPKNYIIRAILDENNNGKWDTGDFLNKKQPEIIKYLNKTIELRANWDVVESFNLDEQ